MHRPCSRPQTRRQSPSRDSQPRALPQRPRQKGGSALQRRSAGRTASRPVRFRSGRTPSQRCTVRTPQPKRSVASDAPHDPPAQPGRWRTRRRIEVVRRASRSLLPESRALAGSGAGRSPSRSGRSSCRESLCIWRRAPCARGSRSSACQLGSSMIPRYHCSVFSILRARCTLTGPAVSTARRDEIRCTASSAPPRWG